mmetsp:Transcript_15010/g.37392  ORF Transcript_15010/g.37392 Transcript_15010/m.37392 type:complete len:219 (+) Transcript_15010:1557-2213(+)
MIVLLAKKRRLEHRLAQLPEQVGGLQPLTPNLLVPASPGQIASAESVRCGVPERKWTARRSWRWCAEMGWSLCRAETWWRSATLAVRSPRFAAVRRTTSANPKWLAAADPDAGPLHTLSPPAFSARAHRTSKETSRSSGSASKNLAMVLLAFRETPIRIDPQPETRLRGASQFRFGGLSAAKKCPRFPTRARRSAHHQNPGNQNCFYRRFPLLLTLLM